MPEFPDTSAGNQLSWYLERLAAAGEGSSPSDGERFSAALPSRRWAAGALIDADIAAGWRRLGAGIVPFTVESCDSNSDTSIAALVIGTGGKRWRVSMRVDEAPPHAICEIDWERVFDFKVEVREATETDGPVLAEIERRCPLVLGDTSITFDRGDDYFAFARLMEDCTVGLGSVDGIPAAINCVGVRTGAIGGVECKIMVAVHTRVLPEHQGKGLWGAVSRIFGQKYPPGYGVSCGYVSVDNVAMQKGFANTPNKWPKRVERALLDCTALAGEAYGRPATPADASRIVEVLNATHSDEEMYLPYTVESVTARLERAPAQYSWERVWLADSAVVGVWPQGESVNVIIETPTGRTESRRGLVLDYGFAVDGEGDLERLLRAWCGWLAQRGFDTLSIFTSQGSAGRERILGLASQVDEFDVWTPGSPVPEGAENRGLCVDQVYF
jgi:hypothetical protein